MNVTAVYPGTFDPPTYGHLDVIQRASRIYPEVIVAVSSRGGKKVLFSTDERVKMLKQITGGISNVVIDTFNELLIDFVNGKKASVIVRGLRVISDFEYEFQMALTNRGLAPSIETVFLMTSSEHSFFSSTLVKEIAALGGDIKKFVPPPVEKELTKKVKG